MKRYEGLFILNTAGNEEGVDEILDRVSKTIVDKGGKVEEVRKLEHRSFARVADKKHPSGFYATVVFEMAPEVVGTLNADFDRNTEVFRLLVSNCPSPE